MRNRPAIGGGAIRSDTNAGPAACRCILLPEPEKTIPVCEPCLTGQELRYAQDAIGRGWISSQGNYIDRFESAFARYIGVKHSVAVSSGTAALHLALLACGAGPGDEVVVPSFTMAACANAVCYCGARPVFVDCTRDTWTMDPARVKEKLSARTRAILAVHIYGHPVDFFDLAEIAFEKGLVIIEDAAEALGSTCHGRKCGSLGTVSCFSLYANKMITCGEGGVVCTDDPALNERIRHLKNQAFSGAGAQRFKHDAIGYNYRLTNTQAAIALGQLENIETFIELRRAHAKRYRKNLAGVRGLTMPVEKESVRNSYWMFGMLVENDFPLTRDDLMARLRAASPSIETRPFFYPMHLQESMLNQGIRRCTLPLTEEIAGRGLYLPSGSGLQDESIDYICDQIIGAAS